MERKRILIIRCGALGDLVYATSIIDALKAQFGKKTLIDFVSTPGTAGIFKADPRVNTIYPLKHKKVPIWLSSQKKEVINASKKEPYDILVNFEFGKQFRSLVNAVVAKKKVGALVEEITFSSEVKHAVDITKQMFKSIVSQKIFENSAPRLVGTDVTTVKEKYNLPDKFIIISPSNSHQKRNILNYRAWENESWRALIEKLNKEIPVVMIGNKGEDEFFTKLKPYPQKVIDLVGKTPLIDLIGVIEAATGLVATDTGTAHISSAVNTEVFTLIGPTPADVTGPYQTKNNKVHIISQNLECSPCYKTEVMKNCKDNICMKEISVDKVYNTIKLANLL